MAVDPRDPPIPAGAPSAPPRTTAWPGSGVVLSGRYRLSSCVAAGSAAVVWRAVDTHLDRDVAVKLLLPHHAADEAAVGRFRIEALATARAAHPNAVRVFDAASDGERTYLVMELVDGPSLAAVPGPQDPEVVAAVGAQVAAALGAAHERDLVHRDVKPANVLVDQNGWIKVVDFGIARVLDAATGHTLPRMGLGTARYLAPEQLGEAPVGPWTDVYALGLTLWECLAGRPAFDEPDPQSLAMARLAREPSRVDEAVRRVPRALADAIARCTRRDHADRFADGDEAAAAFLEVCGPRPYDLTRRLLGAGGGRA